MFGEKIRLVTNSPCNGQRYTHETAGKGADNTTVIKKMLNISTKTVLWMFSYSYSNKNERLLHLYCLIFTVEVGNTNY